MDIDENKTEVMQQDQEGHRSSYNPPRYKYSYDFYITLHVNNEWFDKSNSGSIPDPSRVRDPSITGRRRAWHAK